MKKYLLLSGSAAALIVVAGVAWLWAAPDYEPAHPAPAPMAVAPTIDSARVSPTAIPVNTASTVTVTARVTDPSLLSGGLSLLIVDATGKTLSTIGQLHDDGVNGDTEAYDRIFSFQYILTAPSTGAVFYRVSAAFRGVLARALSPVLPLTISTITRTDTALVFRDTTGRILFSVPLRRENTTDATGDSSTLSEDGFISDNGRFAGIISTTLDRSFLATEGFPSSRFTYFDTTGLLWTRAAPTHRALAHTLSRYLSSDGSRVLLVSTDAGLTTPEFSVSDASGRLLFGPSQTTIGSLDDAQLSPNGLYLLAAGQATSSEQNLVTVVTLSSGAHTEITYPDTALPTVSISGDGRFRVALGQSVFILPRD
jgi:hypothetical protein